MCKLGDIIIVEKYIGSDGKEVSKHSFVVINDEKDKIGGLNYDFVANVMLSFHNAEHKKKKLKYKSNLPIKEEKISGEKINDKEGYIRADELYYFDKKGINYKVIAHMDPDLLDELFQLILALHEEGKTKIVTKNLKELENV